jgi:hypothetical protein
MMTKKIPGQRNDDNRKPKKRVTLEQDKVRQTSHWDLDYLPLAAVDALYERPGGRRKDTGASESPRKQMTHRSLGLICIAAGLGLLALTVTVGLLLWGGGVG